MTLQFEILAAFAFAHLVAAASPGPNFVLLSKIAISVSRTAGVIAAMGILASAAVWSISAALGLNLVLDTYPTLRFALRFVGAAYLIWLGSGMIMGALRSRNERNSDQALEPTSAVTAFGRGFLVNITNPKTIAYYTSIFALLVPEGASKGAMVEIVIIALSVTAIWWISVALLFSNKSVANMFYRIRCGIEFLAGSAFIVFGTRMISR